MQVSAQGGKNFVYANLRNRVEYLVKVVVIEKDQRSLRGKEAKEKNFASGIGARDKL